MVVAFATACWVILAIPWFYLEQPRPGQNVPPGMNIISVGLRQLVYAMRELFELRQTFIYLIGYFLLGDSLNTMVYLVITGLLQVTVFATLQNEIVSYDTLTLLYLLIVGIAAQAAGIGLFWLVRYLSMTTDLRYKNGFVSALRQCSFLSDSGSAFLQDGD